MTTRPVPTDAQTAQAHDIGKEHPEWGWILFDDLWIENPHYNGSPSPHPDEDRSDWGWL